MASWSVSGCQSLERHRKLTGPLRCRKPVCEVTPPINSCNNTEVFMGAGKGTVTLIDRCLRGDLSWDRHPSVCEEAETRLLATNLELFARSEDQPLQNRTEVDRFQTDTERGEKKIPSYCLRCSCFMSECALKSDEIETSECALQSDEIETPFFFHSNANRTV